MSNELERLHLIAEELIALGMCYAPRMSKIASDLYGKPVNIHIDDYGEIWYRTEDGEHLSLPDITDWPIMYPNNY